MKNYLPLLTRLADQADKIALKYFNKMDIQIEYKKDTSPVSEADKEIEEFARKFLNKNHKNIGIFGEEFGEDKTEIRLIIDPIDGTRNFIRGIPIFATLLAIEEKGEIVCGLVSAPALSTRWFAAKNKGAYVQNMITKKKNKIAVSNVNKIEKAQLFYGSIYGNEIKQDSYSEKLLNLLKQAPRQRGFGDFYQHMLVAQGSGEAALDPVVQPWDIAPIKIILEEAGGEFSSFSGNLSIYDGTAISSNGTIHQEIIRNI